MMRIVVAFALLPAFWADAGGENSAKDASWGPLGLKHAKAAKDKPKVPKAKLVAPPATNSNDTTAPPATTPAPVTTPAPTPAPYVPLTTTMRPAVDSSASSNSGDSSASLKSIGSGPRLPPRSSLSGSFNQGSWASDSSVSVSSGSTASGSFGSQLPIWLWILLICCCCGGIGGIGGILGSKMGKPKKRKGKKDAPGSTTLTEAVEEGDDEMHVSSDDGFEIGDMIVIGDGTAEMEVNEVKAFGSIICATPLKNDHPKGTKVAKVEAPGPGPGPAEAQPLMPQPATSQVIPSYAMAPAPQYTYAAPATTSYAQYAAPQTMSYIQPVQQQAYTYAAPATTAYAQPQTYANYAQPQTRSFTSYAAPQQQFYR